MAQSRQATKASKDARYAALARDKRKCRECGKAIPHPHVHHIAPWTTLEWADDLDNLLTLCPACHRKAHTKGLDCLKRKKVEFEFMDT